MSRNTGEVEWRKQKSGEGGRGKRTVEEGKCTDALALLISISASQQEGAASDVTSRLKVDNFYDQVQ